MAPPRRGFDHRRPVMSGTSLGGEVVDLTNSDEEEAESMDTETHPVDEPELPRQRLPRYDRAIIDLSTDSSPVVPRHHDRHERRNERLRHARSRATPEQEHSRRTPYLEGRHPPSLIREGSSDVTFMRARHREDTERARRERQQERVLQEADRGTPSPPHRPSRRDLFDLVVDAEAGEQGPGNGSIDLTDGDDEVVFVSERLNPNRRTRSRQAPHHTARPHAQMRDDAGTQIAGQMGVAGMTGLTRLQRLLNGDLSADSQRGAFPHIRDVMGLLGGITGLAAYSRPTPPAGGRTAFAPPGPLNYAMAGFNMGYQQPPQTPQPPYEAPEKPPIGFTRSPAEDEVVVCPNCGDELCVGEGEEKRSVWVVKACGHVYCGQCMTHRRATKANSKGKARDDGKGKQRDDGAPNVRPFKECVVDGCDSKVSARTSVIQLFL
ncbi:hypothetical protein CAC42_2378 [Sphaceloma murrayae]|uniref:RING-type domain-containing protein n=1 Tax=Sphaceloma murrayae TaxID=2082308 RepID=A0A2K1QVX3_9PEZI|nr:hypothetical protein CAC42_2378 [Sphaceloma murrayae]